ncbi:MAG: hypothetical protein N2561_09805 [Bacteroidetes bacterium]|nr:hypothetical protein [Rhodothermia bacterium]MCS7155225.1 hypothetical protein [Bacteroidota bacterium]MCX7907810.1 hypothetical protein [Bacteroidota bacterium]MDW8138629.1 hypothetical protein [Bacteroidota bacterium]MDW8284785.1 hypothetical protein [Bacteroidota bacterium]
MRAHLKTLAWAAGTGMLVFLATYVPMRLECATQAQRRHAIEGQLQAARALAQLGAVLERVAQNNYGWALDEAGRFFDSLQAIPATVVPADTVRALYGLRDLVIGDLNTLNPEVSRVLWSIYRRLRPYVLRQESAP